MKKQSKFTLYEHQLPHYFMRMPFLIWPVHALHSLLHNRKTIVLRTIKALLKEDASIERVLDAGCGEGNFVIPLAHKYPSKSILGVDYNQGLVDFINKYASFFCLNLKAQQCDLNVPNVDGKFHLVVSIGVLHMLKDDAAFLKYIYAKLEEGGKFVVHVAYAYESILKLSSKDKFTYDKHYGSEKKYTPALIHTLLRNAGFSIKQEVPTNGWYGTVANELFNYSLTAMQSKKGVLKILHGVLFAFIIFPFVLLFNGFNRFSAKKHCSGMVFVAEK